MIELLRSNFLRLIKSASFYVALAVEALYILLNTINFYLPALKTGASVSADPLFPSTVCNPFAAALLAVVCSLFIGADYQNGTIRNKLVIGHPRSHVYLANLITVMVTALCMNLAAMAVFYPVTLPLLGGLAGTPKALLKIFIFGNLIMLVYASLYTMVAMNTKSTVASLVITVTALIAMSFVSQYFISQLNAPLTYTEVTMNDLGEMISTTVPNPYRKSEAVLDCFRVLLNLFPSGQLTILGGEYFVSWQTLISCLCLGGASAGAGIAIFSKLNLK